MEMDDVRWEMENGLQNKIWNPFSIIHIPSPIIYCIQRLGL